jgi:hypothetical protein
VRYILDKIIGLAWVSSGLGIEYFVLHIIRKQLSLSISGSYAGKELGVGMW